MGVLTMDMSSYEIERNDTADERYGEEVLYAGWVPALGLREALQEQAGEPSAPPIVDVESFLRRMYALQR